MNSKGKFIEEGILAALHGLGAEFGLSESEDRSV
jgi:hypothetical protein